MRRSMTVVTLAMVGALALGASASSGADAAFWTSFSGAAEVPGPGDPDGGGAALLHISSTQVCYKLAVTKIAPATAAHIHLGAAGVAGSVVVPLQAPTSGAAKACAAVAPALASAIKANPANYYVNVHNAAYPGGAVRGQLARK